MHGVIRQAIASIYVRRIDIYSKILGARVHYKGKMKTVVCIFLVTVLGTKGQGIRT